MITISKLSSQITKTIILSSFALFSSFSLATIRNDYSHPVPTEKDVLLNLGAASQNSLPKRMNILVWNLHKGSNQTFSKDFTELASDKDLIVGQEMLLNTEMKIVFSSLSQDFFATATSFFLGKTLARTGVATASTVAPKDITFVRTETLEPVVNSPKVTLITSYPIKDSSRKLTIVNIHGINFVDSKSFNKEINRIYEAIKNIPSPIIFTGDFNSWNGEREKLLKEVAIKLKMNEADFFPDNRMKFNGHPLDHFFHTNDIRIVEAKVEGFYQGSDHKPLELIVDYKPALKLVRNH